MSKFNRDTFITIRNQESADQTDYISVGMSACGIAAGAQKFMTFLPNKLSPEILQSS